MFQQSISAFIPFVYDHRAWGYVILFLGMILEGEVFLIVSAMLGRLHAFDFGEVLWVSFAGILVGDIFWYEVGVILSRFKGRFSLAKTAEKTVLMFFPQFNKRPFPSIFFSKFIYGVKIPFLRKTIIPVTDPQRGDIVVFIYPNDRSKDFIKRVIGVAGDKIEIKNKKIFLNGKEYTDSYGIYSDSVTYPGVMQPRDNFGPVTVPAASLFVMGDNRDESADSRYWGFVDLKDVEGKALIIYWSWNSEDHNLRWQRIGNLLN